MEKATEIPMTNCGLSINCGEDGVWLCFRAQNGKSALVNANRLVQWRNNDKYGVLGGALSSWCSDRQKQAAEIRASMKE